MRYPQVRRTVKTLQDFRRIQPRWDSGTGSGGGQWQVPSHEEQAELVGWLCWPSHTQPLGQCSAMAEEATSRTHRRVI